MSPTCSRTSRFSPSLGHAGNPSLAGALSWVESLQERGQRWKNRYAYNGKSLVHIERQGQPSKWVTLRARTASSRPPGQRGLRRTVAVQKNEAIVAAAVMLVRGKGGGAGSRHHPLTPVLSCSSSPVVAHGYAAGLVALQQRRCRNPEGFSLDGGDSQHRRP